MNKERNITLTIENLTDEQVLKEFVKRFDCDGAVLIYMEKNVEVGFGRWKNTDGRIWVNELLKIIKTSPISILDIKRKSRKKVIKNQL